MKNNYFIISKATRVNKLVQVMISILFGLLEVMIS